MHYSLSQRKGLNAMSEVILAKSRVMFADTQRTHPLSARRAIALGRYAFRDVNPSGTMLALSSRSCSVMPRKEPQRNVTVSNAIPLCRPVRGGCLG